MGSFSPPVLVSSSAPDMMDVTKQKDKIVDDGWNRFVGDI
jgi:hypothetical protein